MVKITKNGKQMEVTKSAFQDSYKRAGWVLAGEKKTAAAPVIEEPVGTEEEVDDSEWEDVEEEVTIPEDVEKPLSQMNSEELHEKAAKLGIDVSDNPNKNQLRERIRKHG